MNYGTDFYLDDNGDIEITSNGDIRTQSGPRLIAQDIREEAETPQGSLPWSPSSGSQLWGTLNDVGIRGEDVVHELERLALSDPRIDATSVRAKRIGDGKYEVTFVPLGNFGKQVLLLVDAPNDKEIPA